MRQRVLPAPGIFAALHQLVGGADFGNVLVCVNTLAFFKLNQI